jgi:hypothetical protein
VWRGVQGSHQIFSQNILPIVEVLYESVKCSVQETFLELHVSFKIHFKAFRKYKWHSLSQTGLTGGITEKGKLHKMYTAYFHFIFQNMFLHIQ